MSLQNLVLANIHKPFKVRSRRRDGRPPERISYIIPVWYRDRMDAILDRLGLNRVSLLLTGLPEVLDLLEKSTTNMAIPGIASRTGPEAFCSGFPVKPDLVARIDKVAQRYGCSRVVLCSWAMTQTIERAEKMLAAAEADLRH